MHGGGIFFLRGELPFDKFFGHIVSRLHITPRYRQRLVFPPFNLAHPTLEDDPDFQARKPRPAPTTLRER
jgi:diacylglycerol O-acyltransferase